LHGRGDLADLVEEQRAAIAAQFTRMNGPFLRGLDSWM
jgi:hypothetical protein